MTTKTIILDITEAKLPPLVTVKQGDSGRTLEVVVQDGGKDFAAPMGTTATLRIMDTQGRSASVPGTVVAFGGKTTVAVGLTSEALAYAGKYAADIKLSSPGGSESTLNFWLEVQIAPASDTPIPTPGGGITQEELDRALRQNSAADQAHADEAVGDLAEKTGVKIRPRVCFVDDDGGAPVPTVLFPWMQEHDVPYCFAIATGDIETGGDSFASWADLRAMQADSRVSWSCHAINDDVMADYTPEQMEAKYQRWRRDMTAHGLRSDAITVMYNHGSSVQETIDKVVSKYFRYGFSTTKGINTAPFDSYHMLRVGLFPRDGSYTLAQAKVLVDQLVAVGTGIVVFFTHCYVESFDLDGLTELVEYIRAKGVEITGLEDALRLYDPKTACDCGEWVEVSGEPEYQKSIAKATSATAGQKVANSSDQNCVLTVQVSGKRVRAAGTAYSDNGMISWLDAEGRVIGCIWQEPNKSGDNARFSLELAVPYGAAQVMVSGNSGRQLPRVEVLSSGSGGGVSHEELEQALSEKSTADRTFAASAAMAVANQAMEEVKEYVDEQDNAFFQSLDASNRRIAALEAKPAGVSQADFETYKSQQSESITEIQQQIGYAEADLAALLGEVESVVSKF